MVCSSDHPTPYYTKKKVILEIGESKKEIKIVLKKREKREKMENVKRELPSEVEEREDLLEVSDEM